MAHFFPDTLVGDPASPSWGVVSTYGTRPLSVMWQTICYDRYTDRIIVLAKYGSGAVVYTAQIETVDPETGAREVLWSVTTDGSSPQLVPIGLSERSLPDGYIAIVCAVDDLNDPSQYVMKYHPVTGDLIELADIPPDTSHIPPVGWQSRDMVVDYAGNIYWAYGNVDDAVVVEHMTYEGTYLGTFITNQEILYSSRLCPHFKKDGSFVIGFYDKDISYTDPTQTGIKLYDSSGSLLQTFYNLGGMEARFCVFDDRFITWDVTTTDVYLYEYKEDGSSTTWWTDSPVPTLGNNAWRPVAFDSKRRKLWSARNPPSAAQWTIVLDTSPFAPTDPPWLRQRQRDDAIRIGGTSGNVPSSIQKSIRQAGKNTYL